MYTAVFITFGKGEVDFGCTPSTGQLSLLGRTNAGVLIVGGRTGTTQREDELLVYAYR